MSVAGNVEGIGADDIVEQAGIGPDFERLFLEFQGTACRGLVDEQLRAVFAAREEDAGEAGAVAVKRRAAAADEELPGAAVDILEARRRRFLMHDRDVAERLLRAIGGEGRGGREDERDDGAHELVGAGADRAPLHRREFCQARRSAPDAVSDRGYIRLTHHGASMTSERRYAITVSLSGFASAR